MEPVAQAPPLDHAAPPALPLAPPRPPPPPSLTSNSEGLSKSKVRDCIREKRTPNSRWTPEHWMQVSTPRLVLSHVGSVGEEKHSSSLGASVTLPSSLSYSPAPLLTCSPTVAAVAIPGPALHLRDEQLSEVLGFPVQPSTNPGPWANAGLPEEGAAQGLILAVLQH